MADIPEITAQYIVYNIDESEDDNYIIDFDVFELEIGSGPNPTTNPISDDGFQVFFDDEDNTYNIINEEVEETSEVVVIEALVCNNDEEINVIIEDDEI